MGEWGRASGIPGSHPRSHQSALSPSGPQFEQGDPCGFGAHTALPLSRVPSMIPPKSTYSSTVFPGSSLRAFLANISLWGREKELPQGKESRSTTATRVKKRVGREVPLCGRPDSAWNLPCLPWVQQYQLLPSRLACPAVLGGPEPQGGQLGQRHPG